MIISEFDISFYNLDFLIFTSCVLGLFVLLAVVGTIYDLYGVSQQEKFEEHQKLMEKSGVVNNGFSDSEGTLNGHAGVSRGFTGNEAKKWQPS